MITETTIYLVFINAKLKKKTQKKEYKTRMLSGLIKICYLLNIK